MRSFFFISCLWLDDHRTLLIFLRQQGREKSFFYKEKLSRGLKLFWPLEKIFSCRLPSNRAAAKKCFHRCLIVAAALSHLIVPQREMKVSASTLFSLVSSSSHGEVGGRVRDAGVPHAAALVALVVVQEPEKKGYLLFYN